MVAGFLVGPGLLLTNRHVLPTKEVAATSMVEFGYEKDERGVAKPLTQVIKSSSSDLHYPTALQYKWHVKSILSEYHCSISSALIQIFLSRRQV